MTRESPKTFSGSLTRSAGKVKEKPTHPRPEVTRQRAGQRLLTDAEIEAVAAKVVADVTKATGGELRGDLVCAFRPFRWPIGCGACRRGNR